MEPVNLVDYIEAKIKQTILEMVKDNEIIVTKVTKEVGYFESDHLLLKVMIDTDKEYLVAENEPDQENIVYFD